VDKRTEDKIDKIVESIGEINVTLAKQEVSLSEHIKRTNLLEQKLEPVEKHVAMVNGALKFIGTLALIAGIIEAALKLVGK